MHNHHHFQSQPCGESAGPHMFYGYCHDSGRMRMMNFPDYVNNVQTGYSNLYSNPASALQTMMGMMQGGGSTSTSTSPTPSQEWYGERGRHGERGRRGEHGCGCHDEGERGCGCHEDCGCSCCIRCADTVEFARCGETRKISITFDNDSRRERAVTLELAPFLGENGQQLNWQASLSETTFTLGPCGEKTVVLTVTIDCGKPVGDGNANQPPQPATVDACKVGYATVRAEGCLVRPLVVAVAVQPDHCRAHRVGCLCGCCC
jgi:hypothetical protein